jgi:hypothetical protein
VYLIDNRVMIGEVVQIAGDTVFLSEKGTSHVLTIPICTVQRIEHVDRVGGFVGGFFGGFAGGFLVGGGVGALIGIARGKETGVGALIFAALGAAVGEVAGAIYGVSHGIVHVYQFHDKSVVHSSSEPEASGTP